MIGSSRTFVLLFTVLLFALLVAAAPIPVTEKRALKQFKPKRGIETPTRREAATPSGYVKRDDAASSPPKPSQVYKKL
ncbi:hypothetical protein K438DRAFT_1970491 [Mycena galopus ATCC 62051]|nr:hypothetical protein K438DRAFT_1970491 [Mycena galopus ATCC 62051]